MVSLRNGVLLKLVEAMKMDCKAVEDDPKPVLLQIRSIVPVLEEGDLWPNGGFFLKVSDLSHALYVSLSEEQNEMILGNELKLAQFIYVQKLEKSHPVPLLRGVTPVPGRRRCEGTPEDIILESMNMVKVLESRTVDSIVEKGVISEKKIAKTKVFRGTSDFDSSCKISEDLKSGCHGKCTLRTDDFEKCSYVNDADSVDNDSDTDSVLSSASSSRTLKRRSWNETELFGVKEIFDSSVVKSRIKMPPRSRSANVSPVRSVRYDSSDDNSSSSSRRQVAGSTKRLIKGSTKSQAPVQKANNNTHVPKSLSSLVYERKGAETGISWNSLPPNLVKLGKEVVRQRDVALLAAAAALQEACASERLLNSLSMFSQFPLAERDDLQPNGDKFFDLYEDMARTRLIMQSLTSISPFRTQETDSCPTNSIKETLSIALERKKNTMAWIKSAVALDLSLSPELIPPNVTAEVPANTVKNIGTNKPRKGSCIIKKNRSSIDIPLILSSEKEEQPDWKKGSTLSAATDLASSLQDESRKVFLSYVEKYIDEVDRMSSSMESDGEMTATMQRVKLVSDWLDAIVNKDGNGSLKDGRRIACDGREEAEAETYLRVRNKIYGILLKHVEKTTAMALQRFNVTCRRDLHM